MFGGILVLCRFDPPQVSKGTGSAACRRPRRFEARKDQNEQGRDHRQDDQGFDKGDAPTTSHQPPTPSSRLPWEGDVLRTPSVPHLMSECLVGAVATVHPGP